MVYSYDIEYCYASIRTASNYSHFSYEAMTDLHVIFQCVVLNVFIRVF